MTTFEQTLKKMAGTIDPDRAKTKDHLSENNPRLCHLVVAKAIKARNLDGDHVWMFGEAGEVAHSILTDGHGNVVADAFSPNGTNDWDSDDGYWYKDQREWVPVVGDISVKDFKMKYMKSALSSKVDTKAMQSSIDKVFNVCKRVLAPLRGNLKFDKTTVIRYSDKEDVPGIVFLFKVKPSGGNYATESYKFKLYIPEGEDDFYALVDTQSAIEGCDGGADEIAQGALTLFNDLKQQAKSTTQNAATKLKLGDTGWKGNVKAESYIPTKDFKMKYMKNELAARFLKGDAARTSIKELNAKVKGKLSFIEDPKLGTIAQILIKDHEIKNLLNAMTGYPKLDRLFQGVLGRRGYVVQYCIDRYNVTASVTAEAIDEDDEKKAADERKKDELKKQIERLQDRKKKPKVGDAPDLDAKKRIDDRIYRVKKQIEDVGPEGEKSMKTVQVAQLKTRLTAAKRVDVEAKFKALFPITKEMNSIRASGVALEDIRSLVVKNFKLTKKLDGSYTDNMWSIYYSSIMNSNEDNSIGVYYGAGSFGGIPLVAVGAKDKATWLQVRDFLRSKKLVR